MVTDAKTVGASAPDGTGSHRRTTDDDQNAPPDTANPGRPTTNGAPPTRASLPSPPRCGPIALWVGLALLVGGSTAMVNSHLAYQDARRDWRAMSDRLGNLRGGYDAAASDALHERAERLLEPLPSWSATAAVGALLIVLTLDAGKRRRGGSPTAMAPAGATPRRGCLMGSTIVDGTLLAFLYGAGTALGHLFGEAGWRTAAMAWGSAMPWLVLAVAALPLSAGTTLGVAVARCSPSPLLDPPTATPLAWWRRLVVIGTLPVAAVLAFLRLPLLLAGRSRRPTALDALHLAAAGIWQPGPSTGSRPGP